MANEGLLLLQFRDNIQLVADVPAHCFARLHLHAVSASQPHRQALPRFDHLQDIDIPALPLPIFCASYSTRATRRRPRQNEAEGARRSRRRRRALCVCVFGQGSVSPPPTFHLATARALSAAAYRQHTDSIQTAYRQQLPHIATVGAVAQRHATRATRAFQRLSASRDTPRDATSKVAML